MLWIFGGASGAFRRMAAWFGFFHGPGVGEAKVDADKTIEALKAVSVSRDFRTGHPELVKRFKELTASYRRMFPSRDLIVTCVYRSTTEQMRLWKQGRFGNAGPIVTNCDGQKNLSQHNHFPSRAVDVAVVDGGKVVWDDSCYYPLGVLAKECGLEWGGWWEKFKDLPHFQLPKEVA